MALEKGIFRTVHTSFWNDSDVIEWSPEDKYFYLYLMTCPHSNMAGIFEIPIKLMERDTGYAKDAISAILKRFIDSGKISYNHLTREIAIHNWLKYRGEVEKNQKLKAHLEKIVLSVKDKALISKVLGLSEIVGYEAKTEAKSDSLSIANQSPIDSLSIGVDILDTNTYTKTKTNTSNTSAESAKADTATNETLPALSSPAKSLKAKKEPKYGPVAHAVKEVIWNGTIKASGLVLTPQQSGAQAKALWEVVNRIVLQFGEEDAVDAAHSIIGTYNRLRQSDRFMAKQPLTPLALAGQGIWGQVLEAMREQRLTPEMQDFVAELLKAQGGRS